MPTSTTDQLFLDLRGLPCPHGALAAHELLLLHCDRDTAHDADGMPLEATELPGYRVGPDGQLLCSTGAALAPPATRLLDALVRNFALVDEDEAMVCLSTPLPWSGRCRRATCARRAQLATTPA